MELSGRYSVGLIYGAIALAISFFPMWAFSAFIFLLCIFLSIELSRALSLNLVYSAAGGFLAQVFFNLGLSVVVLISFFEGLRRWSQDVFLKAIIIGVISGLLPAEIVSIKREFGAIELLKLLAFVWSVDTASYFVGKRFGKKKVFGKLSPNKTLEGLIGGIIAGLLVLIVLKGYDFTLKWGISLVMASVIGDLIMSFIKRLAGIKDFSKALGEHGGLLDRLDALIFTAPFYLRALRGF